MAKTLLVTDDAMIIREMIKDITAAAGWTIVGEAVNGQEAIDQFKRLKPDAVTLDLVMPKFDGLHALRGIIESDPGARVLLVSALDQAEILKEALQLGAIDFVVKPFNEQRLLGALEKMATAKPRIPEQVIHIASSVNHSNVAGN